MYGEFKYFSFNGDDWDKGLKIKAEIKDNGIVFKEDKETDEGTFYSLSIDSTESEMLWHRMAFETDISSESHINLYYFTSDKKEIYIDGKYYDIDGIIKCELELNKKVEELENVWAYAGAEFRDKLNDIFMPWLWPVTNPTDILLHKAKGRYLWFKIKFKGKEAFIKGLRIYYPRMSYLDYLPSAYSSDNKSRDFLERFLSIFGSVMSDMEEEISKVSRYFDIDCVEGEYLKWLASWLSIKVDESWDEKRLKKLMRKAPEIYKRRGTKQAIIDVVEIFTGKKPAIVEYFQLKDMKGNPAMKELYNQLYTMDPYTFCVIVSADCVASLQQQLALQKLLDEEKPAFTKARLIVLQPHIYLDSHTYLGVNTVLSELPTIKLDGDEYLYNNVIYDEDEESN